MATMRIRKITTTVNRILSRGEGGREVLVGWVTDLGNPCPSLPCSSFPCSAVYRGPLTEELSSPAWYWTGDLRKPVSLPFLLGAGSTSYDRDVRYIVLWTLGMAHLPQTGFICICGMYRGTTHAFPLDMAKAQRIPEQNTFQNLHSVYKYSNWIGCLSSIWILNLMLYINR